MGIKGLIGFLSETAPGALSDVSLDSLSGTTVAIDASTALYQFTIAIREGSYLSSLHNEKGESTSHIAGLINRSLKLLETGIKPIFVFDSTPPEAKLQTLAKRKELRQEAEAALAQAKESDDKEAIKKYVGRTVHISKQENDSAKQLLRLMGVPVVEAEEEAEAQCAYLVKQGLADAVATEDADALVFGCGTLLKNLTASNKKIVKVELPKVLQLLKLSHEEFTDFCILCGCDYCGTLKGIGPKTAYNLICKYKNIAKILEVKSESLEGYEIAQQYFRNPKVKHIEQIPRGEVDVEGLKDFLVVQNNFAEERVNKIIERLIKAKTKKAQLSLNSFFGSPVAPKPQTTEPRRTEDKQDTPAKRDLKAISADENSCTKDVIQAVETKRVDRPVIGIAAVCPSNKRWFGTSKCERRVEKPVPIEVDETAVPPHLQRFICVRHFEPRVTIKRTNPREVDSASVDNLVTHLCKRYGINTDTVANAEKEVSAGGEGPLWPNPLLKRFRASTSGYCKPRLQELWRSSSSHGISWDAFDKLYITFREARDANAAEWDKHAPDIADFASKVAREKIIKWCNSTESCPPRLLRKWTHLLYTRWRERYMHVYGPRMLSRYLKGEVTDRVLMREINECTAPGVICSQSPFSTEASGHNPHFVHRVVRDEPANE